MAALKLKTLLKTASEELRAAQVFHRPSTETFAAPPPPRSPSKRAILRFTTPAIHIHDPDAANKLFRYLTTTAPCLSPRPNPRWSHLKTYIFPSQTPPSLQICRLLTSLAISHTAASGSTAFAVLHPPPPNYRNFGRYLLPFTAFPLLAPETPRSGLSPLAVCHYFVALHTCGILLPPSGRVPPFVQGCVIEYSQHFRYVPGRGEMPCNAVRALIHAVNTGALETLSGEGGRPQEILDIRKWALSHPANRRSGNRLRAGVNEVFARNELEIEGPPLTDLLTTLSTPFPTSTRMQICEPMIHATAPRERWHCLSFLDIIDPNTKISSLAAQNPELCRQLEAKCHMYLLTCLDGHERGFQVCHWGEKDCLPIVVEMEIVEEGDGSRSIAAMRLVQEVSVRVSFKGLPRAEVGNAVCWRGCCGLVESLGLFVCGVPGDLLAVPDCSLWFVGLI